MEQGYFSAEKLVTKKIKLENIVEEGFIELTQDEIGNQDLSFNLNKRINLYEISKGF